MDGYVEYISLVNLDDEYVVPGTGETGAVTFSTSVSSILENSYYTTNTTLGGTVRRLSKDGSIDTSVDGNNVEMFKKIREIDGFLIGGASKSSKKFIDIIKNYYR